MERPIIPDAAVEPVEQPYDADLDAQAALDAAFDQAQRAGKRVLIVFGGAWCPDCRILAGMLKLSALQAFLHQAYEVVEIDVGRYDLNQDVVARAGFHDGLEGAPTVIIATEHGAVVNRQSSADWRTARARTAQDLADYLHAYATAAPPDEVDRIEVSVGGTS